MSNNKGERISTIKNKVLKISGFFSEGVKQIIKFLRWAAKNVSSILVSFYRFITDHKVRRFVFKTFHQLVFTLKDLAGFSKKPLRHASHVSIMLVILIILLASPFSVVMVKSERLLDPMGANKAVEEEIATDVTEEYQIAATLASIFDEELAEDAFKKANEVQLAASLTLPMASAYALTNPITIGDSSGPKSGELYREYTIQDGDTLWTIARANNLTVDSLRWANGITDIDNVKPGSNILIPSTVGVLHTVRSGDTLSGIASRYKASVAMIESYNNIIEEELEPGMKIMVPDGVGAALPKPKPVSRTQVASGGGSSAPSYISTSKGPNRFPYGYCTWWVANKRYVPWNGNAWAWYGNSQAYGRSVGKTPVAGSIMVSWESRIGHVAYVEQVHSNGSFTVSEMNYRGWGRMTTRTVTTSQVPLIGFIY